MSGPKKLADLARFSGDKMQKVPVFEADHLRCDLYCLKPGQTQKIHAHDDSDKVMLCISGQLTAIVGKDEHPLPPGSAALAPAGTPHALRNDSPLESIAYVITTRTGDGVE